MVQIKGLSFLDSLPYFIIPGLVMVLGFYWLMPALEKRGINPYISYSLALGFPLLLMFIASFVVLYFEGQSLSVNSIMQRFRLKPIKGQDWLWIGGVLVAEILINSQFAKLTQRAISRGWI